MRERMSVCVFNGEENLKSDLLELNFMRLIKCQNSKQHHFIRFYLMPRGWKFTKQITKLSNGNSSIAYDKCVLCIIQKHRAPLYDVEREINLHQMEIMLSGPILYSDNWISSRNKFYIQTFSLNDYLKLYFDGILVGIWRKKMWLLCSLYKAQ